MNEKISNAEALAKTTDSLRESYPRAKNSDVTLGSLLVAFPNGCVPDFDNDGSLISISIVPENPHHVCDLLEKVGGSKEAYDALVAWAAAQLLNKRSIPNRDVELFLISHLLGEKTRPTKTGRPTQKAGKNYQHAALRLAVSELEREGFIKTRNVDSKHRKSACDIVAKAMADLGFIPRTCKEIEKILRHGDRAVISRL